MYATHKRFKARPVRLRFDFHTRLSNFLRLALAFSVLYYNQLVYL